MPLDIGQTIDGKYRVIRMIGEGGMGTVYEGQNVRIGKKVAIKVLHAQVASRPEFRARFEREARAAARIGSDHICDVYDLGDLPNGECFIVMEFLEGDSIEQRIVDKGLIDGDRLVPIAFEMLEALATMHEAGVIHRDLKPANVYLARTASGRGESVKILDFGVSKFSPLPGESSDMTVTGTLMGTPLYMSPEQARGLRDIDGRADIYSASVIFYRALCGQLPFTAENFNELMFKIALEEPKPLREIVPGIDPDLAAIIHKGLARAPEARHQTARAYQEEIVGWARKQGRLSLSLLRISPSEKALVVASRKDGPPTPSTLPDPESAIPTASMGSMGKSPDGTPYAWSEAGPLAVAGGTQIIEPEPKKKEVAPPKTDSLLTAQTIASSGVTPPSDAGAKSQATAPARSGRWIIPAIAAAALVVGAVGWNMTRHEETKTPPPVVATAVPPPETKPIATTAIVPTPPPPPPTETVATPTPDSSETHATTRPIVKPIRPVGTASVASSTTPPPPSATPTAPPTGSAKGRVFRTNLD